MRLVSRFNICLLSGHCLEVFGLRFCISWVMLVFYLIMVWPIVSRISGKLYSNFIFAMQEIDATRLFDRVKLVTWWCMKDKLKDSNYGLNQYGFISQMYWRQ